jgi:prolyl-tRNA synthetase
LELAPDDIVVETTGAQVGFAGPIGLKCPIYYDETVKGLRNFLCGGNETDKHWLDVNLGRDGLAMPERFYNLRNAQVGDTCAACGQGKLGIQKGIEVGHIFQLGRKYSEAMKAVYTDVGGGSQTIWMGCYGIGVSRIMAAAIEQPQNYDSKGMIWPESLAPYKVVIMSATSAQVPAAETLYQSLLVTGEVVLDDRDIRIGAKFADADLIGYPYQIIVGRRAHEGIVEVKNRRTDERKEMSFDEAIAQFSQC